ncbi:MAG: hypothetical protein IPK78_06455 [Rhodospirillales bacterium]|nr:hypothetical protein [Rhodospirillales bacterium]
MHYWKIVKTVGPPALGAIMFAAGVPPDDVVSNLSKWPKFIGIENIPSVLLSPNIDIILRWGGAVIFVGSVLWLMVSWLKNRRDAAISNGDDFPDTSIQQAAYYIAKKSSWGRRTKADCGAAVKEIRRAAMLGSVAVWGNKSLSLRMEPHQFGYSDVLTPIRQEYWEKYTMLPEGIDSRQRNSQTEKELYGDQKPDWPRYNGLFLNMNQVRKTWPPRTPMWR